MRSPGVVARTFRAAQEREKQRQEALGREKAAHDKRLAELREMIRNLAQAGGNDGALVDELRKLNEEYAKVEGQLRDVDAELFPAERERVVRLLVKGAVLSPDDLTIRTNGLRSGVAEGRDGGQSRRAAGSGCAPCG